MISLRLFNKCIHYPKTWILPSFIRKIQKMRTSHCWHQTALSMSNENTLLIILEFFINFTFGSKLRVESTGMRSTHFRKMEPFFIGYEVFNKPKPRVHLIHLVLAI